MSSPRAPVFMLIAAGLAASFQIGKVPPVLPAIRADMGRASSGSTGSFPLVGDH